MAIEIVDLPINSMVIFHSFLYVYQRLLVSLPHLGSILLSIQEEEALEKKRQALQSWSDMVSWAAGPPWLQLDGDELIIYRDTYGTFHIILHNSSLYFRPI